MAYNIDQPTPPLEKAVFIDACVFIALLDDKELNNEITETILELLYHREVKLCSSTHVHSEVVNRLIHVIFESDVVNSLFNDPVFNPYIMKLINKPWLFSAEEKSKIMDWFTDPSRRGYPPVDLRRKWSKIYKSRFRDYLMPYVLQASKVFDTCKNRYNISLLTTGEREYHLTMKNVQAMKLLSQDAYHLSVCESYGIPYLLTYDGDFNSTGTITAIKPNDPLLLNSLMA